uniref:Secreted protein n=1 Tax=Ascaris lumbricoides TaxID=6252 RepID=A0A0M3IMH0_ASCLU
MDVPGLSKVAQALCVTSCKYQVAGFFFCSSTPIFLNNCGTGRCEKRRGRPVCVCSRCASGGGSWPNNCGTGHCEKRRGRPVCVCSRCASGGGSWPNV